MLTPTSLLSAAFLTSLLAPPAHASDEWPQPKSPKEAGVDEKRLADLIDQARATKTDALIVLVDGALVCEEYFDKPQEPIELMSCTKSVVSLLVGIAIDGKKIASVDAPVSKWYPDWKKAPKKDVTVGHLLSHTSGIKCNRTTEEIYASKDFVKLALDADLADPVGTRFFYNNKAVNLIAGVLEKSTGKKMDAFAREKLFEPMDIHDFGWTKDAAGNPHGMSGLQLHAIDFAKLGQLALQGGEWEGERIVSEKWIAAATYPVHPELGGDAGRCGYLWWLEPESSEFTWDAALIERWKKAGGSKRLLEVGAELEGKRFSNIDDVRAALRAAVDKVTGKNGETSGGWFDPEINQLGVPFVNEKAGPIGAYSANGYLGNYLVVCPKKKLVAVRQRRYPADDADRENPKFGFNEFTKAALALVEPAARE